MYLFVYFSGRTMGKPENSKRLCRPMKDVVLARSERIRKLRENKDNKEAERKCGREQKD